LLRVPRASAQSAQFAQPLFAEYEQQQLARFARAVRLPLLQALALLRRYARAAGIGPSGFQRKPGLFTCSNGAVIRSEQWMPRRRMQRRLDADRHEATKAIEGLKAQLAQGGRAAEKRAEIAADALLATFERDYGTSGTSRWSHSTSGSPRPSESSPHRGLRAGAAARAGVVAGGASPSPSGTRRPATSTRASWPRRRRAVVSS
jgi:hypothetical protein